MNYKTIMILITFALIHGFSETDSNWVMPASFSNRSSLAELKLTSIGAFGIIRKARPQIPAHYHTGIDIVRPTKNYIDEKIYPVCKGVVISIRDDGPYAQIIIQHVRNADTIWTVYEHVAGISCSINSFVEPNVPIARFFTKSELDKFGWQFDHFHFEVMKKAPIKIKPTKALPWRHYKTHGLNCYTQGQLIEHYYNPIEFLNSNFN